MGRRRPSNEDEIEVGGRPSDETKSPWEVKKGHQSKPTQACKRCKQTVGACFFPLVFTHQTPSRQAS